MAKRLSSTISPRKFTNIKCNKSPRMLSLNIPPSPQKNTQKKLFYLFSFYHLPSFCCSNHHLYQQYYANTLQSTLLFQIVGSHFFIFWIIYTWTSTNLKGKLKKVKKLQLTEGAKLMPSPITSAEVQQKISCTDWKEIFFKKYLSQHMYSYIIFFA